MFREGFLSAYPWRYAFDATIGAREPRGKSIVPSMQRIGIPNHSWNTGRKWYAKYYNSAIAIASPEFDQLRGFAVKSKVYLSVGIIEKDGGTLYCTAILIDRSGKLLYAHRKVSDSSLTCRPRKILSCSS